MKKITINNTDLEIAPVCFGGNVFGWTLDENQSFDILDKYIDLGFNFIDTADTYAWWVNGTGGQSEEIIGKWIKSRNSRDKIIIATKVGSETKEHGFDISKNHILKSADESLKRLGVEQIDLYYTHFDDNKTPIEETLAAYQELIEAGKIKHIAASNLTPERLMQSFNIAEQNNLPKYAALQPHYNLMERENFESNYAPIVSQFNLSVFPYWSLASGFLTGKYRTKKDLSKSQRGGAAEKYINEKGTAVLGALDIVANKHNTTQASIALAWLINNPLITAPIASATNENQLKAIAEAPNLILDDEDISILNNASQY